MPRALARKVVDTQKLEFRTARHLHRFQSGASQGRVGRPHRGYLNFFGSAQI
jgi:hypothetical protein